MLKCARNDLRRSTKQGDFANIAILILTAFGIGVYLIATTVLISKDGVFYIERAQEFSKDPIDTIKGHPFGYPFLIFLVHKIVSLFSSDSSIYVWIYSGQIANLVCRTLSFIPLYFIGKIFVGQRNSFYALLILAFLPYPTKFGSDVLRDWPNIFFLSCGFWAILWGAKNRNWRIFFLAGLSAGLGYMIRPVCVQLIVYGAVWLTYCFVRPDKMRGRNRTLLAATLLICGFLIPAGPYTVVRGKMLPDMFYPVIRSFISGIAPNETTPDKCAGYKMSTKYTAGIGKKTLEAADNLVDKGSANLMWYFVLPLMAGICHHLRKIATVEEKILMMAFITLNIISLFLRYSFAGPYLTHRYILPLTVFTIFYIPTGLNLLSYWIVKTGYKEKSTPAIATGKARKLFYILLIIGLLICLPKLLRPIRTEKQAYLSAAKWLEEHTSPKDVIVTDDGRLYFYARREGLIYKNEQDALKGGYVVKVMKNSEGPNFAGAVQKEYYVQADRGKNRKKLVIYKIR